MFPKSRKGTIPSLCQKGMVIAMDIALISPKGVKMGRKEEMDKTARIYADLVNIDSLQELMSCPNSPLLTIAAMATPYFDQIAYIDEETEEIDWSRRYDMVGMSFMTQQASRAYELADAFRARGVYTICGGMHPTNLPGQTLEHFDTVFIGEGEHTWPLFMQDYREGRPRRLYRNDRLVEMSEVLQPRYDLLDFSRYRTIPVQISRGCPHNCEFCASTKVYGPVYRHKSVQQVMEELQLIRRYRRYPHVYFTDDNMLVNPRFSLQLLREMKGMGIHWMTHTDIGVASRQEILRHLYDAGCRKMVIGFESIVPQSLQSLEKWKFKRLPEYAKAIRVIQSYGIGVWGTFIVGLDSDDRSVFQRVVDFTMENHLYGAMISVPTPFPGSALFDRLNRENRILTKHWGDYTLWNVVVRPKNMTVEELEEGFSYTLRQIYSPAASRERQAYFRNIYRNRLERP